jgi:hypothetical protein
LPVFISLPGIMGFAREEQRPMTRLKTGFWGFWMPSEFESRKGAEGDSGIPIQNGQELKMGKFDGSYE